MSEGRMRAEKARLRAEMKARLASLGQSEAGAAAEALADHLLALPEVARARHVFCCLSFGTEIDTHGLVRRLGDGGRQVYVPRTRPGCRLDVHPYPCAIRRTAFGLEQPTADAPRLPPEDVDATLDVALVLGLAFDRRGFRLGYGAGYFDRFLDGRPFPALGLAHACQLLDTVPVEDHDVPMAAIVTNRGVWRPG